MQNADGIDDKEVFAGALVEEPIGHVNAERERREGRAVHWGTFCYLRSSMLVLGG